MQNRLADLARRTQDYQQLQAKDLCQVAGISPPHWSDFRRGKTDLSTSKLWAALVAMEELAPGSAKIFCRALEEALTGGAGAITVGEQLEKLIAVADREEMARAMVALSKRFIEISDSAHERAIALIV